VLSAAAIYVQSNLTSDVPGLAANLDPHLKNPWGVSFNATSPFWVSDQVTNVATLYNGAGVPNALVVSMPAMPAGGPTGQVFNPTTGFELTPGHPALFIFATLGGTIAGWNPAVGATSAVTQFTATDGAVYTGLTASFFGSDNMLYAADNRNGKIDVFNSSFTKTTVSGSFTDPNVPAGLTPYNIQIIGGLLYVEYARLGAPGGFVAVYDTSGNLLRDFGSSHLNAPWGVTLAPSGFGTFANDLLVGNFGDGTINAFDPATGAFLGTLSGTSGMIVNSGLWSLEFRAGGSGFDPNTLFFTAGINGQADGLFGAIQATPEPATLGSSGAALAAGLLIWLRRRR
jgi:uncharacterized protein (TIGR03118 family)